MTTATPRIAHVPALDGLRGVAVIGVVAFHLGHLGGGFLGVDLFFVLSGYLITSLLLAEWQADGRIDLGEFWARRARRLLPALFVVLVAVAAYAASGPGDLGTGVRGDALATLGYVANWHAIVAEHGYWDLFAAPSLLAHTWSLAIEEQLYVAWPLVVVLALRRSRRALLVTTVALGTASAMAMVVLHGAGDDTARVYYGTDTRAAAVLAGAALAAWGVPTRGRAVQCAGWIGAVGLAWAWFTATGATEALYEGGFLLCAVAATAVIAAASRPGVLARVLSFGPLRHLGLVSYGVYLWHWPVFVVLTPDRTGLHGWPLLVAELAVTLAVSEASYRLVELPIRRGSLRGRRVRLAVPVAAAAAAVAVLAGTGGTTPAALAAPSPPPMPPEPSAFTPTDVDAEVERTRLLVVGDSGAAFLGDGLARVAGDHDVEVRNAGTIGCGLVTAGGRLRLDGGGHVPDPEWCSGWPARWQSELAAFRPDIALLVIGWPGLGDREVDGRWRHPCDPSFDGYYEGEVRRALVLLASTGARVVVADSPYLTLPVVQSDHAARIDCLNAIYRREASRAGAAVLGLREWLCESARTCTIETGGVTLRTDGIHFRDAGADVAARWALPELLATARPR